MRTVPLLLPLLAALLLSACTPLTRTADQPLSPEELRMRAVEGKLGELNRRMVASENRDDNRLQDELRGLRGEIERLRFDVDSQDKRGKELYLDIDRRVQKLESLPSAVVPPYAPPLPSFGNGVTQPLLGPVAAPAPGLTPPSLTVDPSLSGGASSVGGQEEETAYLRAFDFLKAQKYDSAISGFRAMLDKWPQGSYADNGWYWMGEAYYAKHQYKPGLEAFNALLVRFPASPKVADALFKGGLAQWELGDKAAARATWARLIKDYSNSNAAVLAGQRLKEAR